MSELIALLTGEAMAFLPIGVPRQPHKFDNPDESEPTHRCPKCLDYKADEEYYWQQRGDGSLRRSAYCRGCTLADNKRRREEKKLASENACA